MRYIFSLFYVLLFLLLSGYHFHVKDSEKLLDLSRSKVYIVMLSLLFPLFAYLRGLAYRDGRSWILKSIVQTLKGNTSDLEEEHRIFAKTVIVLFILSFLWWIVDELIKLFN